MAASAMPAVLQMSIAARQIMMLEIELRDIAITTCQQVRWC